MEALSKVDKVVLGAYLLWAVLLILNPPWAYFHRETGSFMESSGHHFIFDESREKDLQIHFSLLFYQVFALTLGFGSLFFGVRWIRERTGKGRQA